MVCFVSDHSGRASRWDFVCFRVDEPHGGDLAELALDEFGTQHPSDDAAAFRAAVQDQSVTNLLCRSRRKSNWLLLMKRAIRVCSSPAEPTRR